MNIASTPVSPLFDPSAPQEGNRAAERTDESGSSFGGILREFIGDVTALQRNAGHEIEKLTTGETSNLHQVMVAVEESSIATALVLEIRNRAMEGYQEIMRMQV